MHTSDKCKRSPRRKHDYEIVCFLMGTFGWESLEELLSAVPPEAPKTPLPRPAARLDVQRMTVAPPGETQPSLRGISFSVQPGQAVGREHADQRIVVGAEVRVASCHLPLQARPITGHTQADFDDVLRHDHIALD